MESALNEFKSLIDRLYKSFQFTVETDPELWTHFLEEDIDDLKVARFHLLQPGLPEGFVASIHDYIRSKNSHEFFHLFLFNESNEIEYKNQVYRVSNYPLDDDWFKRQLFRAWIDWRKPKMERFKAARFSLLKLYAHQADKPLSFYRDMVLMFTCDDYHFSDYFWKH